MDGKLKYLLAYVFFLLVLISCKIDNKKEVLTEDHLLDREKVEFSSIPFQDLDGKEISLSNYKGKRVLLHFWATWCKPCMEELPALSRALPKLKKENYHILLVSDESLKEISDFHEKSTYDFEFIRYQGALSDLKIYALPTTFILDEKGLKIKEKSGRMDWDSEKVIKEFVKLP